jgi:hypothetical protein
VLLIRIGATIGFFNKKDFEARLLEVHALGAGGDLRLWHPGMRAGRDVNPDF